MAQICHTVQDWVEENIEKTVEDWENRQEQRCREEDCNWWMACLNKLFCWFEWVVVKIARTVLVTIGKWIPRVICEVISFALDVTAVFAGLVLSIPGLGGILRAVIGWGTELIFRFLGLGDFGLSLIGIRPEKRIYVSLMIPTNAGDPITTEAAMMPMITAAQKIYQRFCNVNVVYMGACIATPGAPEDMLNIACNEKGFFADWWLPGSWVEFAASTCAFEDGWRRIIGWGGQIIVIPVLDVTPDTPGGALTVGCSFASTHDYVVVEPGPDAATAAHEIGHVCWLTHSDTRTNLMWGGKIAPDPTLTSWQASVVRWSKHCVYF
jgi:hypothetical protein